MVLRENGSQRRTNMRTKEYDREKVLRSAMVAFMTKGYNKTNMLDLKAATGLHPGSLYCAFKNKRGLLLAAIEQYHEDRSSEFKALLDESESVTNFLEKYLNSVLIECASSEPAKDCLAIKALNEIADQDPEAQQIITKQFNGWEQGFTDLFTEATVTGEFSAERQPVSRARALVLGVCGLRTYAHTNPDPEVLKQVVAQLLEDAIRS